MTRHGERAFEPHWTPPTVGDTCRPIVGTSILWGVVHLTLGLALAAVWMRVPIAEGLSETS